MNVMLFYSLHQSYDIIIGRYQSCSENKLLRSGSDVTDGIFLLPVIRILSVRALIFLNKRIIMFPGDKTVQGSKQSDYDVAI